MMMVSLGDMAQSFLMKSQITRLKTSSGRITQELSSGQVVDVAASLNADLARFTALARSRAVTAGYQSAAREAAAQAAATQTAIAAISDSVHALVSPLMSASQLNTADPLALASNDARGRLDSALTILNTSVGGRALFAGQSVQGPAVVGAEAILAALRIEIAGVTTAQEAMSRISDWFDAPTGYRATAYQGGAALAEVAVSASDSATIGVTAEDPAIRMMLKGLTAAALINDSAFSLPFGARQDMARLSAEALLTGHDRLTALAAHLGVSEGRIEAAQSRNAAELLAHEMAQADLIRSDPERLAMELEAVQSNLELVYAITARLSRLSLTDFLR